ncbi:MAG: hypothetical protein QOG67_2536 [Verrucomicrobiota bacterium]
MPEIWTGLGKRRLTTHDAYEGVVQIERALSDWSRVESVLKSKLQTAQDRLSAFERTNANFFN